MTAARTGLLILTAITAFLSTATAEAQCTPDWIAGEPYPGVNGTVGASLVYDPDGAGPLQPLLVVAGEFTIAGDAGTPNIAAWDGNSWSTPFGLGLDGAVRALTTFNGDLIAAGEFGAAGGAPASRIARWDGAAWHPLGDGITGAVYALAVYNGHLYAAGSFAGAGGSPANSIASWDGAAWSPVGASGIDGTVFALASFNNNLYLGGEFAHADNVLVANIASWDGSAFADVGSGVSVASTYAPAQVRALVANGSYLYVGGMLDHAGGLTTYGVARWNGSAWSAAGSGLFYRTCIRYSCHDYPYRVAAMSVSGSTIYAATVYAGGGVPLMHQFNGTTWTAAGTATATASAPWTVSTIADYKGAFYMGGSFSGANAPSNFARLVGTQWTFLQPSIGDQVESLVPFNNGLVVGGAFTTVNGIAANHVAFWDGSTFQPMGAGLPADAHGLAATATDLYASAWPGGIYHWDGSAWTTLYGAGAFGGPPSVGIYNNQVIAGTNSGGFGTVGEETDPSAVGIWNGSAWVPLGTASGASTGPCAFTTLNGSLYAAGFFGSASSSPVARYSGSGWQSLGTTSYGPGVAVAAHNGAIYAAIGYDPGPWIVARWASNTWQQIGGDFDGAPSSLVSIGGSLYVCGSFTTIGSDSFPGIARWDGAAWQPMGSGADGPVTAISTLSGNIIVGGDFASIGGRGFSRFAVYGCPTTPPPRCSADFNCDGDIGTDADIESFFACIAGSCPAAPCTSSADFNGDGDIGTDADIESFFRVLAGGNC